MIVGFDTDDHDIFEEQVRLLDEAGIPFTTSGVLVAIERTPLHERLKAAGRLLEWDMTTTQGHGAADLNFTPKLMSAADLLAGYNWMLRRHDPYDSYRRRLATALARFERTRDPAMRSALRFDRRLFLRGLRIIVHYLTSGGAKRRFFLGTLGDIARTGLTGPKIVLGITFLAAHKHFHEFVTAVHGDPETVAGAIAWPDGSRRTAPPGAGPPSIKPVARSGPKDALELTTPPAVSRATAGAPIRCPSHLLASAPSPWCRRSRAIRSRRGAASLTAASSPDVA